MSAPVDPVIAGEALDDFGFTAYNTISGLGLNTFGFLWGCGEIWAPAFPPVTTVWTVYQEPNVTVEVCTDIY